MRTSERQVAPAVHPSKGSWVQELVRAPRWCHAAPAPPELNGAVALAGSEPHDRTGGGTFTA